MFQEIICVVIVVLVVILIIFNVIFLLQMKKRSSSLDYKEVFTYIDNISRKNQESIDVIRESLEKYQSQAMITDEAFKEKLNDKLTNDLSSLKDEQKNYQISLQKDVSSLKNEMQEKLENFTKQSEKGISDSYTKLLDLVTSQLNEMKKNVSDSLMHGFENNSKTMGDVNVALGKITAAQTNLDSLKDQVVSLNNVLTNTQRRGRFGEVALGSLLEEVYGQTHDLYSLQFCLKSGKRPDAVIYLPGGDRYICIDSKFSLDDYWHLAESKDEDEIARYKKSFKSALREQIKKIKDDYVDKKDTANYAIMFLPSDGIYSYIQSDEELFTSVVNYARTFNVIITSPATLQPILANIRMLQVNYEVSKNIKDILKAVDNVRKQNEMFSRDWEAVSKSITALSNKKDDFDKRVIRLHDETDKLLNQAKDTGLLENTNETDITD
jgi:DNA recombination protein RmuC